MMQSSMGFWKALYCALVGLGIVLAVVPLILRTGWLTNLVRRRPDLHHTHQQPVPRLGGLALVLAFVGVEIFIALVHPDSRSRVGGRPVVICSSLVMFALGFWDDIKPLGATKKLLIQILIALSVCIF